MLPQVPAGQAVARRCESVADWWPQHRAIAREHQGSIQQAIVGGFVADRVGWAFASGYQAALHALFPDAPADRLCALCVTEADGNSPKAIKSTFRKNGSGWILNGAKKWTTLGPEGSLFFVAARDEAASGERPAIRILAVSSESSGLTIQKMPDTRFVPEVPHAQLKFDNVESASLLPGDGYELYVKPFRTVEDIHVQAAILAYLMREAQRLAWPEPWIERLSALLAALSTLSNMPPADAETHVGLAGALQISRELVEEADALWLKSATDPATLRWQRDRELLKVASQARERRAKRAWERLRPAG
jgi:hypothetical protein